MNLPFLRRSPTVEGKLVAIDPGARQLGLACFDGEKLTDYAVKVVSHAASVRERLVSLDHLLARYLEEKRPAAIALEKTNFSHQTNNALLTLAYYKILAVARRNRIHVHEYAPATIRKAVCGHGHATKRDVVKALLALYPELRVFAVTDRRWRERYYFNLFDAVACGLTHLKATRRNV